jgi:hypothetical protein
VFIPRTSSTSVATWFWQRKVECGACDFGCPAEFVLLELRSPSRRIFIGSHSLPLSDRLIDPSIGIRAGSGLY